MFVKFCGYSVQIVVEVFVLLKSALNLSVFQEKKMITFILYEEAI